MSVDTIEIEKSIVKDIEYIDDVFKILQQNENLMFTEKLRAVSELLEAKAKLVIALKTGYL